MKRVADFLTLLVEMQKAPATGIVFPMHDTVVWSAPFVISCIEDSSLDWLKARAQCGWVIYNSYAEAILAHNGIKAMSCLGCQRFLSDHE